MSVGNSVHRFHTSGITNEMVVTKILITTTSMQRRDGEWLVCFICQMVKCSLAALKTAPMSPPRQPMMMESSNSQMEKLDASPLMWYYLEG
mmetsp:Transcript_26330/g.35056  ORF Transcript_26330/g.35056 Transcript_26330/m.35056 type:complete len:91 (-) Transcript_26330:262-534(-)